jgi:hypothetical protein
VGGGGNHDDDDCHDEQVGFYVIQFIMLAINMWLFDFGMKNSETHTIHWIKWNLNKMMDVPMIY